MANRTLKEMDGNIFELVAYHPWWLPDGTRNPKSNGDTKSIMNLKSPAHGQHEAAIRLFRRKLNEGMNSNPAIYSAGSIQIAIAPSSKAGVRSAALEKIVTNLNCPVPVHYNKDFLVRTVDVPSAHNGGPRDINLHCQTISVQALINPVIPMILIDDVKTTGSTMNACERLLRAAGATNVIKIAMGQTA